MTDLYRLPRGDPRSALLRDQLFGPDVPGVADLRRAGRLARSRAPTLAPAGTAGLHDPRGDHLRSLQVSAVRFLAGRGTEDDTRRASLYAREAGGRLHRTRPTPHRAPAPPTPAPPDTAPPVAAPPPPPAAGEAPPPAPLPPTDDAVVPETSFWTRAGRVGRQVAGGAAGAALGFVAGNLPGAAAGAELGWELARPKEEPKPDPRLSLSSPDDFEDAGWLLPETRGTLVDLDPGGRAETVEREVRRGLAPRPVPLADVLPEASGLRREVRRPPGFYTSREAEVVMGGTAADPTPLRTVLPLADSAAMRDIDLRAQAMEAELDATLYRSAPGTVLHDVLPRTAGVLVDEYVPAAERTAAFTAAGALPAPFNPVVAALPAPSTAFTFQPPAGVANPFLPAPAAAPSAPPPAAVPSTSTAEDHRYPWNRAPSDPGYRAIDAVDRVRFRHMGFDPSRPIGDQDPSFFLRPQTPRNVFAFRRVLAPHQWRHYLRLRAFYETRQGRGESVHGTRPV
jgi:hypothetical protein